MTTNAMIFGPDLLVSAKQLSAFRQLPSINWHGLEHLGNQASTTLQHH
jgi:hypothetical protein